MRRAGAFMVATAVAISACSNDHTVDARVTSVTDAQVCLTYSGRLEPRCLDRDDARLEVPASISKGACLRVGLAGESSRIIGAKWVECTPGHWVPDNS